MGLDVRLLTDHELCQELLALKAAIELLDSLRLGYPDHIIQRVAVVADEVKTRSGCGGGKCTRCG